MTERDPEHEKRVAVTQRALEQIPDLYANLSMFLVRVPSGAGVIGGPSGSRPPMDLAVIDLLDEREKRDAAPTRVGDAKYGSGVQHDRDAGVRRQGVLPTLSAWVRDVDGARWDEGDEHQNPPTQRTVPGECGWLIEGMDWIAEQAWFPDFDKDINQIRADLRTAIRDWDVNETLECTKCDWRVVPMDHGTWFRCTGCDESWGRLELHKMAERKRPRPLKECAQIANTSVRTLRRLIEAGLLKHVAADGPKRLFDVQDVVVAVAKAKMEIGA